MKALSVEGFRNSLEILYPVILLMTNRNNKIQLDLIQIDENKRESGFGSEIMDRIISYSELHKMPIELTPSGKFGSRKRRLKKFYKRLGFVKSKQRRSMDHYALIRYCGKSFYN